MLDSQSPACAPSCRQLRGGEPTRLDVAGEPDAEIAALLAGLLLALAELVVVHEVLGLLHRLLVVAAVVDHGDLRLEREVLAVDEVPAAELRWVHVEFPRGEVHHALDDERRLRAARAAVGVDRRDVRERALHRAVDGGDVVLARQQRAVEVRRHRGRERREVRPEVRLRVDAEPLDVAVVAHREFGGGLVAAALCVCHVRLRARGDPLHGPFEVFGGPRHERLVGVVVDLAPEPAADVRRLDAELVLGVVEHARHEEPVDVGVLGRHEHLQLVVTGRVVGHRCPGFHRVRDEELVVRLELHDAVGVRERLVGLLRVADLPVEGDVALGVVVESGRVVRERLARTCHRLPALVVDVDLVECVVGEVALLGDDHRDGVALVAHPTVREYRVVDVVQARQQPRHR